MIEIITLTQEMTKQVVRKVFEGFQSLFNNEVFGRPDGSGEEGRRGD